MKVISEQTPFVDQVAVANAGDIIILGFLGPAPFAADGIKLQTVAQVAMTSDKAREMMEAIASHMAKASAPKASPTQASVN